MVIKMSQPRQLVVNPTALLFLLSQTGFVLSFTTVVCPGIHHQRLPHTSFLSNSPLPNHLVRSYHQSCLFSTSAPERSKSTFADEPEEDDFDLDALLKASEEDEIEYEYEEEEEELEYEQDDEEEEYDEVEMLAAIDETPVGELSPDQVYFIRDIMSYFVTEQEDSSSEEPYNPDDSSAPVVEKLFFRLLDEWHAALDDDEEEDDDHHHHHHRIAVLEPTLTDFTLTMKAWKKDALLYSGSRRKKKSEPGHEAVDRVENLLGMLDALWKEGGMEYLKPNQEIIEIVLSVLASSRQRGMDRRVWSLFESALSDDYYGLQPTCEMYQSVILALARSKDRGSAKKAEAMLKEAVEKFPPRIDSVTGLPTGVNVETFNKVLVAWAKSGLEYGPERAEQLIVYMDDLDRELGENGLVKPNLSSFTTLIDAYAQQRDWDGVSCSERIFNRVLDHYFEGILEEEPNIASWTIVISAWSRLAKKNRRGAEERADKLLKRMESLYEDGRLSFPPDAIAYSACMNAWAFSKNPIGPTQAELILDEMHEKYMDGDDSMRPTARSIQIVIDSWVKMGTEEAMEQAEFVLDRYEDHIESSLAETDTTTDGSSSAARVEQLDDIADIYRSMLFGWSKCDPERAQEYLLDMVDRKMKLDSFAFDKIIEAETQRLPEDPAAMERIGNVFEVMEKCRQAGEVKPNERVFTSYIRAMTRAHEDNLAHKASSILTRMNTLYQGGNKGIKPTIFTYNAVLNACGESIHTQGDAQPMEAFKVALGIFNMLRGKRDGLDHVSFGNMLKCANLLPDGPQKDKFIVTTFKMCCERGLVNTFVIRDLQSSASEELWRSILQCPEGEVNMDILPTRWSVTLNARKNNNPQGYGDKRPFQERRR